MEFVMVALVVILVLAGGAIAWRGIVEPRREAEEARRMHEASVARNAAIEEELGPIEVVGGAAGLELLCVCGEEWCYCTNRIVAPGALLEDLPSGVLVTLGGWPCDACRGGSHVWSPGGSRA